MGFTVGSANKDVDRALNAIALAVETLMKWRRRVFFMFGHYERRFMVSIKVNRITRRRAVKLVGAGVASLFLPTKPSPGQAANETSLMLKRAIPSSGEKLSVIGLGTWNVFD